MLSNKSGGGIVTAPPGFPWNDPLDQIFGITTNSPVQTASVASNQLVRINHNIEFSQIFFLIKAMPKIKQIY